LFFENSFIARHIFPPSWRWIDLSTVTLLLKGRFGSLSSSSSWLRFSLCTPPLFSYGTGTSPVSHRRLKFPSSLHPHGSPGLTASRKSLQQCLVLPPPPRSWKTRLVCYTWDDPFFSGSLLSPFLLDTGFPARGRRSFPFALFLFPLHSRQRSLDEPPFFFPPGRFFWHWIPPPQTPFGPVLCLVSQRFPFFSIFSHPKFLCLQFTWAPKARPDVSGLLSSLKPLLSVLLSIILPISSFPFSRPHLEKTFFFRRRVFFFFFLFLMVSLALCSGVFPFLPAPPSENPRPWTIHSPPREDPPPF